MENICFSKQEHNAKRISPEISPFTRENLLYVQEAGFLSATSHEKETSKNQDSFLCFYVCYGTGTLLYRDKLYELWPGDCVFLDCKDAFVQGTNENDFWEVRWCHFNGKSMPALYENYLERGGYPAFHPAYKNEILHALTDIYETADREDAVSDIRLNEKLYALLYWLMTEAQNKPISALHDGNKEKLTAVRAYIDEHFAEKITLEDLADRFYINKFYLSRLFKEQYDVTIVNYVTRLRLTEAKHLLRFTDKSIEKIALIVGMKDVNYLSRMFKKNEGISPRDYRKLWMNDWK